MTAPYPLAWPDGWPRTPAGARKPSRFDTSYSAAYDNLLSELRLMGATGVVISTNVPLRRDGRPYSEGMADKLDDPGVSVYFATKSGSRVMARDGHPTASENLHAIGHVIGHLRGIERHGGSYMMNRAFSAFTALPAPGAARPWWVVLGVEQDAPAAAIKASYAAKARAAHPDAGGSDAAMSELNVARDEGLGARS